MQTSLWLVKHLGMYLVEAPSSRVLSTIADGVQLALGHLGIEESEDAFLVGLFDELEKFCW